MTRSEMKVYLEGIWEKWHGKKSKFEYLWVDIFSEGILTIDITHKHYHGFSINDDKVTFVNGFLRPLYPTKLEKALR